MQLDNVTENNCRLLFLKTPPAKALVKSTQFKRGVLGMHCVQGILVGVGL